MSRRPPLTNAEVGQAIHDYRNGRSVIDIAAELGCNPVTIYNHHLHKHQVKTKPYKFRTTGTGRKRQPKPKPLAVVEALPVTHDKPDPDGTGDWVERGSCRQTDPELFFPTRSATHFAREAKQVCHSCPVTAECLEHALSTREEFGVWGGLSARERRALMKRNARQEGTPA
jgi:WhiB family redox-sensing transcriptional regulator